MRYAACSRWRTSESDRWRRSHTLQTSEREAIKSISLGHGCVLYASTHSIPIAMTSHWIIPIALIAVAAVTLHSHWTATIIFIQSTHKRPQKDEGSQAICGQLASLFFFFSKALSLPPQQVAISPSIHPILIIPVSPCFSLLSLYPQTSISKGESSFIILPLPQFCFIHLAAIGPIEISITHEETETTGPNGFLWCVAVR